MESQAAETILFFQEVDRNKAFEPIQVNDLQLSADEVCAFTAGARLRQVRPHRYSVGGSVRVMKGVFAGQRQYESKDSFDVVDAGTLYRWHTNFRSDAQSHARHHLQLDRSNRSSSFLRRILPSLLRLLPII